MMKKLPQSQWAKEETASWWSNLAKHNPFSVIASRARQSLYKVQNFLFYLVILLLPTQLGKHFWPSFSFVFGQRIDYLSPTLYTTDILIGLLFFITLIRKQLRVHPLFLVVVLVLSFTVFLSSNPMAGWYYLLKLCEMSFVGWSISKRQATRYKPQIRGVLLAIAIIFESFLAVAQFFLHQSMGGMFYFLGERTFTSETPGIANASIHGTLVLRPYGTFSHPNVLAGFLLIGILLVWYLLDYTKKQEKYLLAATTAVGGLGLLLTLSRTTILLGLGILCLVLFKKLQKRLVIGFFAGILLLLSLFPTLAYRFAPATFEEPAVVRIRLMQFAVEMIRTHPLFGIGLGNFISSLPSSSILQPVHNIYLLWLSETGIVGGCIAGICFWLLFRRVKKVWDHADTKIKQHFLPLLFAFCSILILGLFDHYFLTLQQGQLLLAVIMGAGFSL